MSDKLSSHGQNETLSTSLRHLHRRRKGYGRVTRSISTSEISTDFTKRKKRALQERHHCIVNSDEKADPVLLPDDKASMGSLESTEQSSLSSFASVRSGPNRAMFRRALSDSDNCSKSRRRYVSASSFLESGSDTENIHPNIIANEANCISPLPPSKVKKIRPDPFHRQKSYENVLSLDIQISPERNRRLPLTRSTSLKLPSGRHSPAFSNASSISSFSSLAKTKNLAPCWVSKSLEKASRAISSEEETCIVQACDLDNDNVEMATMSYTKDSITDFPSPKKKNGFNLCETFTSPLTPERPKRPDSRASSRKRGVCDSPDINLDNIILSRVRTTTNSRSRSRSRLFSQTNGKEFNDTDSVFKFQDAPPYNSMDKQTMRRHDIRHTMTDSRESDDDDDDSCKYERMQMSDEESNQISSSSSGDLSTTNLKTKPRKNENSNNDLFKSSIEELISPGGQRELKKNSVDVHLIPSYQDLKYIVQVLRKLKSSDSIAGFGERKTWTIVAPDSWPHSRKAGFLNWAINSLGFCLRPAGGGISYLLISCQRGSDILQHLEIALNKLKLKNSCEKSKSKEESKTSHQQNQDLSLNMRFEDTRKISRPEQIQTITNIPPFFPKTTSSVTKPLRKKSTSTMNVKVSPLDRDIEVELLNGVENITLNEKNISPTLVRSITLENEHTQSSSKSSRFSYSPKDSSFEIHRRARLSGEHVKGSQELFMHCHGISPLQSSDRPRPKRLNIFNTCDYKCSSDTISPPIMDLNMSGSLNGYHYSCPSSAHTHDTIETPMPRRCARTWGSKPALDKDWGISTRCDSAIISVLSRRFEDMISQYNRSYSNFYPIDAYADPSILAIAANTADLGFDHEIDTSIDENNHPEKNSHRNNDPSWDGRKENIPEECEFLKSAIIRQPPSSIDNCCMTRKSILHPEDVNSLTQTYLKKRLRSFAKHRRVSLCTSSLSTSKVYDAFEPSNFCPSDNCAKDESGSCNSSFASFFNCSQSCNPFLSGLLDSPPMKCPPSYLNTLPPKIIMQHKYLHIIFSFLNEKDLYCQASLVCTKWANAATSAHANLAIISLGCNRNDICYDDESSMDEPLPKICSNIQKSISLSMEKSWLQVSQTFPKGSFISEGAFKKVYRVWNSIVQGEEAISVMNITMIEASGNKHIVGAETSTSILLSSLARRGICPNFVIIRGIFTCPNQPPQSEWCSEKKDTEQHSNAPLFDRRKQSSRQMYQYIRMELCKFGDIEEFIRRQPGEILDCNESRHLLFQMAFALHTAGDRFGLKHYDVKLLNFLLQSANQRTIDDNTHPYTVLRYGVGAHVFYLRMPSARAYIAKLADYGTAKMQTECDGRPITLAQFTTLENSPPEFMLLGDLAAQGYGHDCFGLGLCMLHLFTGGGPYEEILEDVHCPPLLKKRIRKIWESDELSGFEVIKSVIFADVYEDDNGNVEGSSDEILYHTLYRYLVLFGIPTECAKGKGHGSVWRVILASIQNKRLGSSIGLQYKEDCKKFSLLHGNDPRIARARQKLQSMEGGLDLLMGLVSFDPEKRWSPLDVINSTFMKPLREISKETNLCCDDLVHSFMAYETHTAT